MKSTLKQIEGLARSLKLKLSFSPEHDPAHDIIDRIIELCGAGATTDSAIEFLEKQHEGLVGASVTQYELQGRWLSVGLPRHQPFGQQVEWCARKGATLIEVTMVIHDTDKQVQLIQTFNINDFKK